jgi:hypothetical protein
VGPAGEKSPSVAIVFGEREWEEEVGRLASTSAARALADRARRQIEAGSVRLQWRPCLPEGPDGTRLPGCRKLYVPIDRDSASAAPFGFVFQLAKGGEGLFWAFIAFGERHPGNQNTRNVYERAHKRLHGRYP